MLLNDHRMSSRTTASHLLTRGLGAFALVVVSVACSGK
jgi:hypothetical protein